MINHRLDLENRIERLEAIKVQTIHELRDEKLEESERVVLNCRYNNAVYIQEMYRKRLKIYEQ